MNTKRYNSRHTYSVHAVTETPLKSISTKVIPHNEVSYFTSYSVLLTLSLSFEVHGIIDSETLDSSANT